MKDLDNVKGTELERKVINIIIHHLDPSPIAVVSESHHCR
jgi:hypothetical protein